MDHGVNHNMNNVQHRLLIMIVMEREDQENSIWVFTERNISPQASIQAHGYKYIFCGFTYNEKIQLH